MGRDWRFSFAAVDADRERKNFNLFSERIFLWYEREHTGIADIKKSSFVSLCDFITELFTCIFFVISRGLIVEIENSLANI